MKYYVKPYDVVWFTMSNGSCSTSGRVLKKEGLHHYIIATKGASYKVHRKNIHYKMS